MTDEQFATTFTKLQKKWPRFYTDEMGAQVFAICGAMSLDSFDRKISEALWFKDPPRVEWFQEISNKYSRNKNQTMNFDGWCGACHNCGWVRAEKDGYDLVFRCHCDLGNKQQKSYKCDCGRCSGIQEIRSWDQVGISEGYSLLGPAVFSPKQGEPTP